MRKKILIFMVMSLLLMIDNIATAEEKDKKESLAIQLMKILVTPTKTPKRFVDAPLSTSVVTADDIKRTNAQDVAEALEKTVGVKIERYGGLGATAQVHMRGLFSPRVLVLVDDRPINSPSLGSADLSWISTDDIERIEVVRGPNSALYGANAVGGVINIITNQPPTNTINNLSTSYGSWNTSISRIENGSGFENFDYLLSANFLDSDGEKDNSNCQSYGFNGKFKYKFNEKRKITFASEYYEDRRGNPGMKPAEARAQRNETQLTLGNDEVSSLTDNERKKRSFLNSILEWDNFRMNAYFNDWNDDNHNERVFLTEKTVEDNEYRTFMYGTELRYLWQIWENNLFTLGTSLDRSEFKVKKTELNTSTQVETCSDWKADRLNWAVYLQDEITIDPFTLIGGLRWDDPSDFGSQLSPKVNLLWKLTKDTNFRASFGKAYRAPSLNDLNWPSGFWDEGNPNLRPEKARSYEVGIEHLLWDKIYLNLSLFKQKVEDMIVWTPTGAEVYPGFNKWTPSNLNKLDTLGVELEASLHYKDLALDIGYAYLDAKQKNMELLNSATNTYEEKERFAAYTPKHKIDIGLSYDDMLGIEGLKLHMDVQYVCKTYNYYQNWSTTPLSMDVKKLPGYVLLGLKISKKFKNSELYFTAENLTDKEHAKFGGSMNDRNYPLPGRNFTGGLKVEF